MRPAAAIAPMTHPFFSTCLAAPVDIGANDVETPDDSADCVMVAVSVAVRMPVAVVAPLLVDSAVDSVLETEEGTEA